MSHTCRIPTVAILTLGCKVNQYESAAIAEALEAAGFSVRSEHETCDLYIVNTCTVTAESDRKARQLIRRLLSKNPAAYMIVTGCSAQSHVESIAAINGVDAIVGNREKLATVEIAARLVAGGVKLDPPLVQVPALEDSHFERMRITRFGRTRAYVKIEDGCESRCAYCAIPAARGPIRSKAPEDVLREVRDLTERGCREIVLTGIETGAWGRDLGGERLGDLLARVDAIPGIGRIRLGSLDPTVMTADFVSRIASLSSLAPHFHLSMQSGCSQTLSRMRRKYNATQAMAAIERIRAAIPHVQFTTDMIVGFPGETEAEFAESLAFAEAAEFLHIHVFPFSRRAGTPAATMPNQVAEDRKHARVAALSHVSACSCAAILDRTLRDGSPVSVLPETRGCGHMTGHTPNFMEVRIDGDIPFPDREIPVLPVRREGEILVCRPL